MIEISYALAVVLRVLTLAMASFGIVLQRKSHTINDSKPLQDQKNALKRPLWHLGFWLYIFSSIISDIVGISSLPLLVIALIGTLLLFFNAIFSHFILQENMSWVGWFGTLIVAVSSAGLAVILNLPNSPKTVDELYALIKSPIYIIYSVITILILIALSISTWYCLRKRLVYSSMSKSSLDGTEQLVFSTAKLDKFNFYVALLYASLSTILAASALVFAKITYELIDHSVTTGQNQFTDSISIVFLIITIVTTVLQLVFFNYSLHYYPTLFTIPFGYSIGIILACLNTLIYYDSFYILDSWKSYLVVFSVLTTIYGIYLLSRSK